MKKLKSTILFVSLLTLFAVILCFNSSAAEWKVFSNSDIKYHFDEDTGVTVIKGDKSVLGLGLFGFPCDHALAIYNQVGAYCEECSGSEAEIWADGSEEKESAQYAARNTKTLIVDENVKKLGNMAFHEFKNVKVVILPETITEIPAGAFAELEKLETVILSTSVKSIGVGAFYGCKNLKTVNLTKNLKIVEKNAFWGCNYDYIEIPATVKTLEEGNKVVPDNLKAVKASVNVKSIDLEWDKAKDANGYRVFIRQNGKWKKLADVFGNENYTVSVKANTKYTFAVRPFNALDLSYRRVNNTWYDVKYSKLVFAEKYVKVTVTIPPEKPEFKLTSKTKGKVTIKWDNVEGETGYQVWYSTKSNKNFKKIANYKANTTSATKAGLTSGKKYYFKVRAYKKTANGYLYSNWQTKSIKVK